MDANQNDMNHFTAADIERYWKGELPAAEMHAMEKAALEDPFLAEAMEGYQYLAEIPASSASRDMEDLHKKLEDRVSPQQPVIVPFAWWKPAIAAMLLISAGAIGYYFWKPAPTPDLVKTQTKVEEPVVVAPAPGEVQTTPDSTITEPGDIAILDKPSRKKSPHPQVEQAEDIARRAEPEKAPVADESATRAENKVAITTVPDLQPQTAPVVATNPLFEYKGIVLNEEKKPVPGAIIHLKGRVAGVSVVTDTAGKFKVPVADSVIQLTVSSVGYESDKYQLSVMDSTNDIAINLKPSNSSLNEVVVTGYSAKKKSAPTANRESSKELSVQVQDAVPVPGWNDYNLYLQQKQVVPDSLKSVKGNVVLSFLVAANGKLSSFIVEQSLDPELDREAIRLVKSGPAWKILKGRKARVIVIVPF